MDLGEPYVYVCHAGLVVWAVPVLRKGQYHGAAVSGRVLMFKPDAEDIKGIINRPQGLQEKHRCKPSRIPASLGLFQI